MSRMSTTTLQILNTSGAGDSQLKLNIGGSSFRIRMTSLFSRVDDGLLVDFAQMDHETRSKHCDEYLEVRRITCKAIWAEAVGRAHLTTNGLHAFHKKSRFQYSFKRCLSILQQAQNFASFCRRMCEKYSEFRKFLSFTSANTCLVARCV